MLFRSKLAKGLSLSMQVGILPRLSAFDPIADLLHCRRTIESRKSHFRIPVFATLDWSGRRLPPPASDAIPVTAKNVDTLGVYPDAAMLKRMAASIEL